MRRNRRNKNKEKIKGEPFQTLFLHDPNLILYSIVLLVFFGGLFVLSALFEGRLVLPETEFGIEFPGYLRFVISGVLLLLTAFSSQYLGRELNVVQRRNISPFFFVILLTATNPYFFVYPMMAVGAFCGTLLLWWVFSFTRTRKRNEHYFWLAFILSVLGLLDKQLFLLSLFFLIFSLFVVKSTLRELLALFLGALLPIYGYYSIAFLWWKEPFSAEEYLAAYKMAPTFERVLEPRSFWIHILAFLLLMVNALYVFRKRSSIETQAYREQSGFLTIYTVIIVLSALFLVRFNLFLSGMLYQAGAFVIALYFVTRITLWSKILFAITLLVFLGLGIFLYFQHNELLIIQ